MESNSDCLICDRLKQIKQKANPFFIAELHNSYLVLGDHQFFKGYCLLITKEHHEDLTDLSEDFQKTFMADVHKVGRFLKTKFKAKRMNYSCLGNFVPHVHYHLFPRYEEDLANEATRNPWHCIDFFEKAKLSENEAKQLSLSLREDWLKFCS